jgi:hypothetical protein
MMLSFRLGAFGKTVLEVELGEVGPEPYVVPVLDTPTTQRNSCFFAETAEDVAWDTALESMDAGCGDDCCEDEGD